MYGLHSFSSRRLIYTSSFYKKCLKPYQKFRCMKTYLQIMIQTHLTVTVILPPSYVIIYTVQKAS